MISSNSTPCFFSRWTRSTVWLNGTLRSSSPWISSTGDFHLSTEESGEDENASFCASFKSGASSAPLSQRERNIDQSCTPWKSTPALKRSEEHTSELQSQ